MLIFILISVILAIVALAYFNRAQIQVAFYNRQAAAAAARANAAQAAGDQAAVAKALIEQRTAETKAKQVYTTDNAANKPTVSGEVDGKVVKK